MNSNNFYAASAFFNGLFGLFVVSYIYLRNKKNPVNRSFLCFGLAVTGWSLIYALWSWAENAQIAEFYVRRHMMFAALIPAGFFYFAAHFTGHYERFKKAVIIFYVLGVFYSAAMLTPAMITGVKDALFFKYWPVRGWMLSSHVVYFFIVVLLGFGLLISHCFKTSGPERQRAVLVLIAFLIGFGGGCINWFLWFDIPIPPTTNFFVGLMFAVMGYAMVRHGLMDVDTIVEILKMSRASGVGILASSVNHEIRNPLYIAKGKLESQIDAIERGVTGSFEEEAKKSRLVMTAALAQVDRAMETIQRFSDFVKPQVKQAAPEKISVKTLTHDVLALISNEVELKRIRFDESALNGEFIHANRRQMEEVLFNLVVNACQAMEDTGGTLAISSRSIPKGAVIEVADNGPGIPKENMRKIFEPFYSTKAGKGTGLGLYITKQLVERNGGRISVKSKPGAGTTFRLELAGV